MPGRRIAGLALAVVALLIAVFAPRFFDDYVISMFVLVFLYAALNQSWNVLAGFAGQMSLGHAAFFGVGAYTSTLLLLKLYLTPWLGLLVGALLAGLLGLFIGFLSFRYGIRGVYFVLITLAFSESLRIIDSNWDFTGGASGLLLPTVRSNNWLAIQFISVTNYYYVALGLMILFTVIAAWIARSPLGLYLAAIREDDEAAAALGVNTLKYKLIAMVISGAMTAVCGTFLAQYFNYIDPLLTFSIEVSIQAILAAVVGGIGTVVGPVLGSFILTPLSQVVAQIIGAERGIQTIAYGVLLILITLLAPSGIWPPIRDRLVYPLVDRLFPEPEEPEVPSTFAKRLAERRGTES